MTNEEIFLREGAEYFGNRLIYKNKDVGVTAPGAALVLLPEGEKILERLKDITDVVVKETKSSKKATKTAEAPKPEADVVVSPSVDDILG